MIDLEFKIRPPSLNSSYGVGSSGTKGWLYMNECGHEFKFEMSMILDGIYKGDPIEGRIKVYIEFHYTGKYGRDIDSGLKITLDALNKAVYKDDNQIREMMLKIYEGKEEGVFEDKIIVKVARLKPIGKLF